MKAKINTSAKRNATQAGRTGKAHRSDLKTKRAKAALGTNEERLRNIFDSAPISIWEEDFSEVKKDLDELKAQGVSDFRGYLKDHPEFVRAAMKKLKVIDVNEMTLKLYEAKNKNELLGSKDKTFGPETLVAFREELSALAEGKTFFGGEVMDRTVRGNPLHLWRTIVFPQEAVEFKSVLVCLTDITEQKRVEEELKHSYSLLNATLESTADGILVVANDGKVTSYNRKFLDLWGIPESLAAQKDDRVLLEFVLSQLKDPSAFIDKVEALYQSPEMTSFDELEFLDDRIFERFSQPQRSGNMIIGRVWSFRDITESKQGEKALRESEARLLTVLEASPIPITLNSLEDGVILYGNSALAELLRVSPAEIIGQRLADFYVDPKERSRILAELERLDSIRDQEVYLRRQDGSFVWVSLSTEKTMLDGQVYLLSSFYDITERKQAEALQSAIYQISEAANNVISLDELFHSVHEIIGQVMSARNFYIALYDSENDLLSFPYYVDEVDGSESIPATKPGRGMTEYVIRTGKPLLSDVANFEELAQRDEVELVGSPSPIWVGAPLVVEGRTIGAIALQDYRDQNVYSERELRMLEYVSGQVAKAIERTRLYADIQRNNRILSALQEATLPLIKQTELSEVLQEILKQVTELFETTDGYIYLIKPDESEIVLSMGIGPSSRYIGTRLTIGEGLAGKVWERESPVSVDNYDTWSGRSRKFDEMKVYASAAVPLTAKSKIMGVLGIGCIIPERQFDMDDIELLTRFAELASIAIENARLYTMVQQELMERTIAEEALREAEGKYRELVERLPVVVYTSELGASGAWQYVSPQIESLLGFTPEEWLADPNLWYQQMHPADRDSQANLEEQTYAGGNRTFDSKYRIKARDGREVWVRDTAYILPPQRNGLPIVQGVLVDITQQMQAEEHIKHQVERLKALSTIDMFIAGGTDLRLTMQTILNQAASQLRVDAADILLLNPSMHVLEFAEGVGFRTRSVRQVVLRVGEGFAGRVVLERETITHQDAALIASQPALAEEGFASYFGMPLIAKGEVKGVLEIFHRSQLDVDSEWMDFLESLAGQAALAIDNASLFDSLQRSNLDLGMAYETTLEGWSAALDLRDKETEGHTQRVTNLTLRLAEAMRLGERERVHMRRGALLHDIGKMGIPDRILLKPDQLTEEEWEIMRQHPTYAYNLLSPISYLRPALDIPYCHHEKWDGTGYPRQLKGEAIPLSARIFAVADVWDALCSDRPYRLAWTKEKALEHIKSLSGVHFDPNVVELFLKVVGQG
jgi:PAS domain S-box-containing protein